MERTVDCTPGHATTMWSERQEVAQEEYETTYSDWRKPGEEVLQGKHQKLLGDKKIRWEWRVNHSLGRWKQ